MVLKFKTNYNKYTYTYNILGPMISRIKHKLQKNKKFKLVNFLLKKGKKQSAEKILFNSFKLLQKDNIKNINILLKSALINSAPVLNVKTLKSTRKQNKQILIPVFLSKINRVLFSMKSLTENSKILNRSSSICENMKIEVLHSSLEQSKTVKTKKNIHKSAYQNYTTAHYRWF
tara:strand:+ start:1165 stop:1686 length:522 start_codon:yes stop_codon:yes gene_type:complete